MLPVCIIQFARVIRACGKGKGHSFFYTLCIKYNRAGGIVPLQLGIPAAKKISRIGRIGLE
jgi:hypothetical protein